MEDYDNPPKTVVGADDPAAAATVMALYRHLPGPKITTRLEVAEMVKYADNAWHAVKVAFGNEIGNIAKASGMDSWEVMDIFCQDRKLNLSAAYLRPGFAFGGSCLPKDVRALTHTGARARPRAAALERGDPHQRPPGGPGAGDDPRDRDSAASPSSASASSPRPTTCARARRWPWSSG